MTTASPSIKSVPYSTPPVQVQHVPDSVLKDSKANESPWDIGADEGLNEVHVDQEPAGHESASRTTDRRPDYVASHTTVDQMSPPDAIPARRHAQLNTDASYLGASCETSYLYGCTAASISLLVLSVASFVIPSISTVTEEHGTVQALGYTAGVISLLSGLAAGACVISIYKKSEN
jgi:hypothetical protein